MFLQRAITAIILIPLVLLGLFKASPMVLSLVLGVLTLGMAYEWCQLIELKQLTRKINLILLVMIALTLSLQPGSFVMNLPYLGLVAWAGVILMIIAYPRGVNIWGNKVWLIFLAIMTLTLFFHSFIALHLEDNGAMWTLYVLLIVWSTDIGGYVMGKLMGKHKMIPQVSPGKTWEGTLGGLIWVAILAFAMQTYFQTSNLFSWYLLAGLTWLAAVIGDLSISVLKRRVSLKDTGSIFPGHGGFLDRLDSIVAAMPCFYYVYKYLMVG